MNFVLIGSFCAASLIDSLATSSLTPLISNSTLPGLITATQYSGEPLPEPILTSAGFLDTGLSGNTLIQIFPPLLIYLVIARRAASIWFAVIQQASRACKPYSPYASWLPLLALPFILPLCCLRYLTLLGININNTLLIL